MVSNQIRAPVPYFSLYFPKQKPEVHQIKALMDNQINLLEGPFGLSEEMMNVLNIRENQIERSLTKPVPKRQFP